MTTLSMVALIMVTLSIAKRDKVTFVITILRIMTLGIMALGIMTLGIMTLGIMTHGIAAH
jgi:hypothetical protein